MKSLVIVLVATTFAASAHAESDMACKLLEIKASNDGKGLDDGLKPLAKKLQKAPFSSWSRFQLLKQHAGKIQPQKTMKVSLVPGGSFALLHRNVAKEKNKAARLRLSFTLDKSSGERKLDGTINIDSGDYYLVGGDALDSGGTYVMAVTCLRSLSLVI